MEHINQYTEAGRIHAESVAKARQLVRHGASQLEVAQGIESFVKDQGGGLAFPVNISVDNEAAHNTPGIEATDSFSQDDVICVDIGVHVDGFIADGAVTIDLSDEHQELVNATETALSDALAMVESGVNVKHIGAQIEKTIESAGFTPIANLQGHGVEQYTAHGAPQVPNVSGQASTVLSAGEVVAIEPFASYNHKQVKRLGSEVQIYELKSSKRVRGRKARQLQKEIVNEYEHLPFAVRWLSEATNTRSIRRLVRNGVLEAHPVLGVGESDIIAQSEHTVLVEEDGYTRIT